MPIVVERSFETASDIVTGPIARLGHRLSRSQAAASRTTNEEEVIVRLSAKRLELASETLNEPRIHSLVRKSLPLDEDSSFADGSEIRNAHIGPFRARAHVDQLRASTRGKALPSRLNVDIVDRFLTVLHGHGNCSLASVSGGVCQRQVKLKDPLVIVSIMRSIGDIVNEAVVAAGSDAPRYAVFPGNGQQTRFPEAMTRILPVCTENSIRRRRRERTG